MREKDFQREFSRWLDASNLFGLFELKLTKTNRLPKQKIRENQIYCLKNFKHKHLTYKMADEGICAKPADCFKMRGNAYLVIMYYKPRKKDFVMIDIDKIDKWFYDDEKKSISEEEAISMGKVYNLKIKI